MTPNYLNSSQSSLFLGGSPNIEDHNQQFHHQLFGPSFHPQHDASSSSHSFHFYFNPTHDQAGYYYNHTELVNHHHQQKFDQGNESVVAYGGSYDSYEVENKVGNGLKISFGSNEGNEKVVGDQEANNDDKNNNSAKWMSSKMRMMHNKMKKSDNRKGGERKDSQDLQFNKNNESIDSKDHGSNCSSYNSSNNPIRVCSDCNTTKTPLWRSGPKGPKSLCNACGIRQRKARRALAAAAATAGETTPSPPPPPPPPTTTKTVKIKVNHQKADKAKNNYGINGLSTVPFKKRCRITTNTNASLAIESSSDQEPAQAKNTGFEDFLTNLSNKLAFHHVFPQDEKEAAILLMALSCGLVHG